MTSYKRLRRLKKSDTCNNSCTSCNITTFTLDEIEDTLNVITHFFSHIYPLPGAGTTFEENVLVVMAA